MIRQQDVHVLGEGTFRVIMTRGRRVAAVIDVPESALGPLHLMFEVTRPPVMIYKTAGLFDGIAHAVGHVVNDVGHAVGHVTNDVGHALGHAAQDVGHAAEHAAEGAFNAASKVATTVARPAFNLARDAAASGAHLIAQAPFIPQHQREQLEAASRIMMRARLGDVTAKDFIRTVGEAAKAGVETARHAGDALLSGLRVVDHVVDAPLKLAENVPLIGGTLHTLDPLQKMDRMTVAIQHGDFDAMKKIVTDDVRFAAGVASLVPGIGSGIGAAISTGLAILDGGGPLDIALHAAYGAIPIPPGIRSVTDAVLTSILSLVHQGSVTDVALAAARNAVPAGLPRDVFDTLAQIAIKRVPVHRAAGALVDHYVKQYAPSIPIPPIPETVQRAVPPIVVPTVTHAVPMVAHVLDAAPRLLLPPAAR
jgi:hypothetical protein